MGACASAPRDPPPEAPEDAPHPAPSSRAEATAAGSPVDPKAGRSLGRGSDSRDFDPPVDRTETPSVTRARRATSRVRVSVTDGEKNEKKPKPKPRARREDSAFEMPPPKTASRTSHRSWPTWLVAHAGDALRSLDGPRDLNSFRKIKQVGLGTYGAVYFCVDERDGGRVA